MLRNMVESVYDTAEEPDAIEVVIYSDDDDEDTPRAVLPERRIKRLVGPRRTMGAINTACLEISTGDIIILGNDDVIVRTPHWDRLIREKAATFEDDVYLMYPNDLFQCDKLSTFPILSRSTCEILREPFPEQYKGAFIDVHVLDIFRMLQGLGHDRIAYLSDVVFEHLHHKINKSFFDMTYYERDRFFDDSVFISLLWKRLLSCDVLVRRIKDPSTPAVLDSAADVPQRNPHLLNLLHGPANWRWRFHLFFWMAARKFYSATCNPIAKRLQAVRVWKA